MQLPLHHTLLIAMALLPALARSQPPVSDYQQRAADGFYSYSLSDDSVAPEEYIARDGSWRGLYSYVDARGQLQTLQHAADRQSVQAAANDLPKLTTPPQAKPKPLPKPASAALELQKARIAALQASLLEELQRASQARRQAAGASPLAEPLSKPQAQPQLDLSDEDLAILERVRAQLAAMVMVAEQRRQHRLQGCQQHAESAPPASDSNNVEAQAEPEPEADPQAPPETATAAADEPEVSVEPPAAVPCAKQHSAEQEASEEPALGQLRTIYTLEDSKSTGFLRFGDWTTAKPLAAALKAGRQRVSSIKSEAINIGERAAPPARGPLPAKQHSTSKQRWINVEAKQI